jgi:hypothetical protein
VPQLERAVIDHPYDVEISRAQADVRAATTALAEAQRAMQARVAIRRAQPPSGGEIDDHFKSDAIARIDIAKTAWLHANLAWRQERLEAANAHVLLVTCEHELGKARVLDQHLTGNDTYDLPLYRGQLASVQEREYRATTRAVQARDGLERAARVCERSVRAAGSGDGATRQRDGAPATQRILRRGNR